MMNKKRGLLVLCMILLLGSLVSAIPQTFSVHGKLENNAGSPLEGTYNMSFNIYTTYTGGSASWTLSNQDVTTDSNGIYNIVLTNVNLDFGSQYYLGVTVGNDSEMSPRINLTSSPYAFEAQNVSVSGVRFNSADLGDQGAIDSIILSGSTADLAFRTRTASALTEKVRITTTGYVGIGTTNPTSKLGIKDTATNGALTSTLRLWQEGSGSGTGASIELGFADNSLSSASIGGFYDGAGRGLSFNTALSGVALSEKVRITSAGNVGIGTTTPQQKLHVNGSILANWIINARSDVCIQGGACLSTVSSSAGGWTKTGTQVALTTATDNVSIGSTDFFVDNSKGYVGIGTTAPKKELDIVGNIKVSGYVYSNGCPNDMAYVSSAGGFCIDKWEASRPDATDSSMGSDTSMAISQAGVIPWVSISQIDSRTACNNAGKRLCSDKEWLAAANIQGQVYYLPTNLAVSPYYCVTDSSTYCLGHSYSAGDACNTGNKTGCVSK